MSSVLSLVEPAYRSIPAFSRTLGPEVAELCELAGFAPDPEQRLGLDAIFAETRPGLSAALEVAVVCARQNLKTGLFKQAALGWLFVTDQRLIVWSAHEFSTAQEAFRDMDELIAGTPFLSRRVKRVWRGNGDEAIELLTGTRLKFRARTKAGGRGLSGDKVVLDEAFALQPDHMGALIPTLSVRPDPQVVYGSSAGLASSEVLRGIRDRGRTGQSPRLAYLEWCCGDVRCASERCTHVVGSDGCALDDEANWYAANPLLGRTRANGTGLTLDYLRAERQALPPEEFLRERLGRWDEPDGTSAVFGAGKWEACPYIARPESLPLGALAVAVSFDQLFAAIGAAALDPATGLVHVRPVAHGPGLAWVAQMLTDLQREHRMDIVVDERGPTAALIAQLEAAQVELRKVGTDDACNSCSLMFDLVQEARVAHERYPELDRALAGAVRRPIGDRWAYGRKQSASDISTLEAVTLAAWAAVTEQDYDVGESTL